MRTDKIFLLVFHGGLVCYLLLHNIMIPMIQNLGQKRFLFDHLQYYFIPQAVLFLIFWITPFHRLSKIPFVITWNGTIFFLSLAIFLKDLLDGLSLAEFSTAISLVAIAFFFIGFFLHFRAFFYWSFPGAGRQYVTGFLTGIIFWAGCLWIATKTPRERVVISPDSQRIEKESSIVFALPPQKYSRPLVEVLRDTFNPLYGFYGENQGVEIHNLSQKNHLIRVEYIKNNRWYFKRVFRLDREGVQTIPFKERGIYRLRSPSSKEIGVFIAVKGKEFKPGRYVIDSKGLRIE